MDSQGQRISKAEAINLVANRVRNLVNRNIIEILEAVNCYERWIIKGNFFNNINDADGGYFELVICGDGNIESEDFKLPNKENKTSCLSSPSLNIDLKETKKNQKEDFSGSKKINEIHEEQFSSWILDEKGIKQKKFDKKNVDLKDVSGIFDKLITLKSKRQQLQLEREIARKKLRAKASALEVEIANMGSKIEKMNAILDKGKNNSIQT